MMFLTLSKFTLMVLVPSINIMFHHKSLLMILLNLELISITMIIMVTLSMILNSHMEFLSVMIIITIATCEASIMLSSLILLNRSSSSDKISSMFISKC